MKICWRGRSRADGIPRPVDLALFRRRQMLRIVLRDVLRFADLSETTEDLSNLADAILNAAWRGYPPRIWRSTAGNFPSSRWASSAGAS